VSLPDKLDALAFLLISTGVFFLAISFVWDRFVTWLERRLPPLDGE